MGTGTRNAIQVASLIRLIKCMQSFKNEISFKGGRI